MNIIISYLVLLVTVLGCINNNANIDQKPLSIPASQKTTINEMIDFSINIPDASSHSENQNVLYGPKLLKTGAFPNIQTLTWWTSLWSYGALIFIIFVFVFVVRKYELIRIRAKIESEKLKELDKIKTRFYMNIAHQFRNPLTVILGMTGELKNNPEEAIKLIEHNSKQILLLINQMLDLSKLESGKMRLNPVLRDIIPYLRYLTESYHSYAASKKIQLTFLTSLEKLIMDHDEEKLQQIVTNLLSNAVKFTPENGNIIMDVNVHKQGSKEELIIKIKDNGIGIPSSELPHIFERFYRVDHSTETGGIGTGIGLALIKELIQLMKGKILVKSELKKGTEFTVILPINRVAGSNLAPTLISEERLLKPAEAQNIKKVKNKILEKPGTEKNEAKPFILIIEDNTDVATYIQTCLDGYRVEKASSGQTGIDKAIELVPDIIVSDVMMPEKNGFEVCQILKNNVLTNHIPIILLTARADIDSRLKGLGAGADAYLSKPFVKEELLIRVKKLLELRLKLQGRFTEKSYSAGSFHHTVSSESQTSEPPLNEMFLKKVYDLVHANLEEVDFGNSKLANEMFLSESQLYRKIKALTGRSTAIHIRGIRLHKAKELLLNSDLTIAEIAFGTGFNDPSYFTRCFSKEFNISPSNFRSRRL